MKKFLFSFVAFTAVACGQKSESVVLETANPAASGEIATCFVKSASGQSKISKIELSRLESGLLRVVTHESGSVSKADLTVATTVADVRTGHSEYILTIDEKTSYSVKVSTHKENLRNFSVFVLGHGTLKCDPEKSSRNTDILDSLTMATRSIAVQCEFFTDGPNGELGIGSIELTRLPDGSIEIQRDGANQTVRTVKAASLVKLADTKLQYRVQLNKGSVVIDWEQEKDIGFGDQFAVSLDGKKSEPCRTSHSRINPTLLKAIVSTTKK